MECELWKKFTAADLMTATYKVPTEQLITEHNVT